MPKNLYAKPLRKEDNKGHPDYKHPLEQRYAEDFLCNCGSSVLAAAEGIVCKVVNNKDEKAEEFRFDNPDDPGNNILIKHENDECSFYAHLQKGSALVKEGQRVGENEKIGLSGNTGYSHGPHLHFSIITRKKKTRPLNLSNFKTIPINWKNKLKKKRNLMNENTEAGVVIESLDYPVDEDSTIFITPLNTDKIKLNRKVTMKDFLKIKDVGRIIVKGQNVMEFFHDKILENQKNA